MQSKSLPSGFVLIDKPIGLTSFDVVKIIRRTYKEKKVGHAGTLDPLASGLMIVLIGRQNTKRSDKFLKLDKSYRVEVILGKNSDTGDSEGVITKFSDRKPTKLQIGKTIEDFTGTINQIPPAYSAIKVNGIRAYKLARAGEKPNLKSRKVNVYEFSKINYQYPKLSFDVKVSSGTYIRSLAEDMGLALGCGAYVSKLRRLSIGSYDVSDSISLDKLGVI